MTKDGGGAAFPHTRVHPDTSGAIHNGMSLRDWFAGMALQGICSMIATGHHSAPLGDKSVAEDAYKVADAMLAERERPETEGGENG